MGTNVAAVLLCWNDADQVIALVEGLRRLEPSPDHIVIVDNGSDGGAAARLAETFPSHEVLALGVNRGFATAVNRGIESALARGAGWIWVLNTDIELPADALSVLVAAGAADERCGMVGALLVEPDGRVQARGGGRVNLWTGVSRHVLVEHESCDYLTGACLLLRSTMLCEVGLFDEGYFFYWEDVDLSFRAREAGWRLAVAVECRVVHLEGASLGRWSEARWSHMFRGMRRFLHARAPLPRTATMLRLLHHSAAMLRHGRLDALRGAWRGVTAGERVRR
jgi:GT2 family glycosyltransferase